MEDHVLKELEAASKILLGPPNLINQQQRQAANEVFSGFKRTNSPYKLCQYILDESKMDYVLFEVADVYREALMREWKLLHKSEIENILKYLLMFVKGKCVRLPAFVREKIFQVVSTLIKRQSCDDQGVVRGVVLVEIESLIYGGDHMEQLMGCGLLIAILNEYSLSPRSSDSGLTMKENVRVKEQFELTDLKKIFNFAVKALNSLSQAPAPISENTQALLKSMLIISETVLTWNFTANSALFDIPEEEEDDNPKLKLSLLWKDSVLDNKVVNLYFTIYWKVHNIPDVAHVCMTCLVQFASLQGAIFENDESRYEYFTIYVQGFLKLVRSVGVGDMEAVGISDIARELMFFLPDVLMPGLERSLVEGFIQQVSRLTCSFIQAACNADAARSDDKRYMEAFDHLMESWMNALMIDSESWIDLLKSTTSGILGCYLNSHLAPPDGARQDRPDTDEYDVLEESDRVKFKDQLQNMGEIVRHCPDYSLRMLAFLIDARTKILASLVSKMNSEPASATTMNTAQFFSLFEDLNWLLLVAGSGISYGTKEIPMALIRYSLLESHRVNLDSTRQVFAHAVVHVEPVSHLGIVDSSVTIMAAVFRLAVLFKKIMDMNLAMFLSPEMICSTLWFLKRWVRAYLMFDEKNCPELSMAFLCSFGRDIEAAETALDFLLDLVIALINHLSAEPDVLEECVDLFIALVDDKEKGKYILKNRNVTRLMQILPNLGFGIKRQVLRGLTLAGDALNDTSPTNEFWVKILKPIQDRLQSLLRRGDFKRKYHCDIIRAEVLDVLDCLIGVAMGSTSATTPVIYGYLSPVMIILPELMHSYHNYPDVVELVLLSLVKCATHFVSYLPHAHSKNLYEASLFTIQEYSVLNSRRLTLDPTNEDDNFTDLLLIMELLSSLFTKDIFDFTQPGAVVVERPLVAADVCLFGLSLIMPLVKTELLKYPELSIQYYKLISYVCQFYPGKILALEEKMLNTVLRSIEFGLKSSSDEVIPYCCDFIDFLAIHIYNPTTLAPLNPVMKPFLRILMDLTLTHQINDCHLSKYSTTLFTLICCYQDVYAEIVQFALESHPEPAVKELLMNAFKQLTENIPMRFNRQNQDSFRRNFEAFIMEVRGFFSG